MNKKELKNLFIDIAKTNDDCESMIDDLRSLESEKVITSDEYDYIITNWDKILKKAGLEA